MLLSSVGSKTIASNCGAARLIEAAHIVVDVTVNHVYGVSQLTHSQREATKGGGWREEGAGARVVGTAALMH